MAILATFDYSKIVFVRENYMQSVDCFKLRHCTYLGLFRFGLLYKLSSISEFIVKNSLIYGNVSPRKILL